MSLATRITLTVTFVLLLGAFVGDRIHRAIFEGHFGVVERTEAEASIRSVQRALRYELDDLAQDSVRLSWSDTLYANAAKSGRGATGTLFVPSLLSASGLDLAFVTDVEGKVLYHSLRHPDRGGETQLRAFPRESINLAQLLGTNLNDAQRFSAVERGVLVDGLMVTEVGPLLVSVRHLVALSDETKTRRGFVVTGRFLGDDLDTALEQRLGFGVDVWPVGSTNMPEDVARAQDDAIASPVPIAQTVDENRIDVFATLDDVKRRPEFLVRTIQSRDISAAAGVAVRSGLLFSLTAALVLLLVLTTLIRALVLRPIQSLQQDVVRIGLNEDYSVRVASGRQDEIGALGDEFDRMLERLEAARGQVIETARAAGMSEIAMGILHNVGNVLNSVNISSSVVAEQVDAMCVEDLSRLAGVLAEHTDDLAQFVAEDPRGQHLQPFLSTLVDQLEKDHTAVRDELSQLSTSLEHVCELVKSQQGLARSTHVIERVAIERLLDDALRLTERTRDDGSFDVSVDIEDDLPTLATDRNKALEIIVNLVQNARQAIEEAGPREDGHKLRIRAFRGMGGRLRIDVSDTGIGIDEVNLARIFQMGFTTKSQGSGLGLHSAANGAKGLGGDLSATSAGAGQGSTFVFELPFNAAAGDREGRSAA